MGLKFRRGTNAQKSGSLAFGEPYVNTDLGTLQIGGLTGDITLGASGTGSAGSFSSISGSGLDITGNANIAGNLTLGGTITIGDAATDNVVVNADLSSSIIPNDDNAFDLGSTSKRYRAIHGTNIYGTINATNGVVSGSSQVVGILSSLNTFSASNGNTSLNSYTGSNDTTNTLQTTRIDQLAAGTASVNLQTASVAGHITDINTYTSSLKTAFSVSGTDLTVIGNLTVQGDTVTLNVSNLLVEDKVIEIASGSTTSAAANGAGIFISGANASILWDNASSTLDINKSIDVVGNVTLTGTVDGVDVSVQDTLYTNKFSTLQTYTASVDSTLARLRESTASLNAFSASENTKSETLRLYTASIDGKFSTLATYTGSNDTTNTTQNTRLTRLEESTASINLTTSSLATTYEGRATAAKTIFSGSSQVVGSAITTNTITIGSTSTALGGTSTTLAGLTSVSSTGFTGALTGNASTATTLATARTINGTSFNGSADITIANLVSGSAQITAGSTTGFATGVKTQLDANTVVSGSGQINVASTTGDIALGTRTSGSYVASLVAGTNITLSNNSGEGATPTIGLTNNSTTIGTTAISLGSSSTTLAGLTSVTSTGFTGALTGNASTATTLQTARAINGVNFDGSAAITVTAAAGTLSGATLAAGVTASSLTSVGTLTTLTVSGATATGALTVTGAITATGDITAFFTSDKRHKNNIQTIPNALEKVTKLNGVTWEWNDDVNEVTKSTPKTGLIAQEVQEVLPEVVKTRDDGFLALDYSKMMGLLVEAIKEQQIQIEELKAQIGSK